MSVYPEPVDVADWTADIDPPVADGDLEFVGPEALTAEVSRAILAEYEPLLAEAGL